MASIGERVKALRTALGWSQPELASRVGISQPSLYNIEEGNTKTLRGNTLAGLCRALNVSPDVLLGHKRSASQEAVLHEAELLALWRAMPDDDQAHVLAIARALAKRPLKPGEAKPAKAKPAATKKRGTRRSATTVHGDLDER